MGLSVVEWLTSVAEAFGLKMASSIDDVIWFAVFLAPDISKAERTKNVAVYMGVCFTQTVIAFVIATSGEVAIDKLTDGGVDNFSSERILTLIAALGLACFSIKLGREEVQERYGEDVSCLAGLSLCGADVKNFFLRRTEASPARDALDPAGVDVELATVKEAASDDVSPLHVRVKSTSESDDDATHDSEGDGTTLARCGSSDAEQISAAEDAEEEKDSPEEDTARTGTTKTLFAIAFCGSLDDLTLFVPLLVGGDIGPVALVIGSMGAVCIIVTFCVFLNFFKPIASFLQAIPLVCITSAFATFLFIKVATMH